MQQIQPDCVMQQRLIVRIWSQVLVARPTCMGLAPGSHSALSIKAVQESPPDLHENS